MEKQLGILLAASGCILIITLMAFLNIAEVRQWSPVFLIGGGALAWFGLTKYRDA